VATRVHTNTEFEGRFPPRPAFGPAKNEWHNSRPAPRGNAFFSRFWLADSPRVPLETSTALSLEICILAGGLSRRMGRDKSRLRLGRRSMLGQIRATARNLGQPVRVIRRDAVPHCGPLSGIYTALRTTKAEAVMFLACDMPFVTDELMRDVLERFCRQGKALFVRSDSKPGFPFVLRSEALATVASQIEQGEFALHALARRLKAGIFSPPLSQPALLRNVNTPKEWASAARLWKCDQEERRVMRDA